MSRKYKEISAEACLNEQSHQDETHAAESSDQLCGWHDKPHSSDNELKDLALKIREIPVHRGRNKRYADDLDSAHQKKKIEVYMPISTHVEEVHKESCLNVSIHSRNSETDDPIRHPEMFRTIEDYDADDEVIYSATAERCVPGTPNPTPEPLSSGENSARRYEEVGVIQIDLIEPIYSTAKYQRDEDSDSGESELSSE